MARAPQYVLFTSRDRYLLAVYVFFGTQHPAPDVFRRAQAELRTLSWGIARRSMPPARDTGPGVATVIVMRNTRQGSWLGIPYDWRRPTRERVRTRWWNRDDHRIFTPKTLGWGYGINVAEVARRLRLLR